MAGNYAGVPNYGYSVFAYQRYPAITSDAFDPVAAGPVRAVGPRPIPVVYQGLALDQGQNEGTYATGGGGSVLNPKTSVVPWIVVGLAALLWLHFVHF